MSKTLFPMIGVEVRFNEKNGFCVYQLHYSADPSKRDPEYIRHIKESMPSRQFKQEYELQWDSFEGLPVFADWDINIHGTKQKIEPEIGLPLLLGFDFGLTPAMIVCQMQGDTLCVLREFTAMNMGVDRFLHYIVPQLHTAYPMWLDHERDYIVFIDPSGTFRKDTDEKTCSSFISAFGFRKIITGALNWEPRKESVESFLTRRTRTGPCLKVYTPGCPVLTRGFQGGYRYNEKAIDLEPNKLRPLKDGHSHIHDALQMVTSRIMTTKPCSIVEVPRLYYAWADNDQPIDRVDENGRDNTAS